MCRSFWVLNFDVLVNAYTYCTSTNAWSELMVIPVFGFMMLQAVVSKIFHQHQLGVQGAIQRTLLVQSSGKVFGMMTPWSWAARVPDTIELQKSNTET